MIENMNDFIEEWGIEEGTIILEPQDIYNEGIVGVTEDKCHLVYSLNKIVESLANSYEKENKNNDDGREYHDYYMEACEWVDYNLIRSYLYMDKEFALVLFYDIKG